MQDNRITRLEQERNRLQEIIERKQRKLERVNAMIDAGRTKCHHHEVLERNTRRLFCDKCGASTGRTCMFTNVKGTHCPYVEDKCDTCEQRPKEEKHDDGNTGTPGGTPEQDEKGQMSMRKSISNNLGNEQPTG